MAAIGTDLQHAADLLIAGELVAIPTETVYGLAGNAYNEEAVLKIFQVKDRPSFDPLIVHVGDRDQVRSVAAVVPGSALALIDAFWPGPLTLVLPKEPSIPDLVTSGQDTVAVRMPSHPIALELLSRLPFPLAAPSANPFGYISPTTPQHVADQLGGKIPYILDGGPSSVGVESTIIGWDGSESWMLYRLGGIPIEAIEKITGKLLPPPGRDQHPLAPGMLASHYAPRKPVFVGDIQDLIAAHTGKKIGVIAFHRHYPVHRSEVLSADRDLTEAARRLFASLRELDKSDCDVILAELFPETGLGRAINDRLKRAAVAR